VIAEVGAWVNLLDPDSAKRKANLQYVTERMALAEAVGARCCVISRAHFTPPSGTLRIRRIRHASTLMRQWRIAGT
jgi:hypothetical protein